MRLEYVAPDDKRFRDWLRRYREEVYGEAPDDRALDAYLKHIFSEQGQHRHIWWGVDGGRKVGFAVVILTPQLPDRQRMQGMVAEFFIYPEYRREGYGRKLAQAVIEFLHQRGINDIHATVGAGNVRGLRFWEACDFTISRYVLGYRPGIRAQREREEEEEEGL